MDELLTNLEERAHLAASLIQALRAENLRLRESLAAEKARATELEQRMSAAAQRIQTLLDTTPTYDPADEPKIPSTTS